MPSDEGSPTTTFSRREVMVAGVSIAAMGPAALVAAAMESAEGTSGRDTLLWYPQPAEQWVEALPLGNGRLGAMVYGGAATERIQLNDGTLWAGGPHDYTNPEALAFLPEIRRLIFAGDIKQAQEVANAHFMSVPLGQMPYQSLGDLEISLANSSGAVSEYRRELDLDTAIHRVSYVLGGVRFHREAFASYPDQVIAIRLWTDNPGAISLRARLESGHKDSAISSQSSGICIQGTSGDESGLKGQVRFCALVHAYVDGHSQEHTGGEFEIVGASRVDLMISMATSYRSYRDVSGDAIEAAARHLKAAPDYDSLKMRHVADYQRLFHRVSLSLGSSPASQKPTEDRLAEFQAGYDASLPSLYFQYGRYLMISCSRPGGQPATLQGLWNDSLTPPWGSKYTTNINTEMNYWPVETCALSECHEPLFQLIAEIAETGKHTAKVHYGARGWVLHHNTDGWRGTAPIDGAAWGIWPTGGAWLCTHLWQHYLFTLDLTKLGRAYDLMKGAAEFFVDTLVPHPTRGWLVTCPSASPENSHHPGQGLCAGPTMDMQIIRDLFSACIGASLALGKDEEFRGQLGSLRAQIAPMQVGSQGQLQEWLEDWDALAPEQHHRHVSHLYGLFPSAQIGERSTPELFGAARRSLQLRGDEGTGWSLAWKVNLWARLLDGDHAFNLVRDALRPVKSSGGGGVYPNLFDAHPPFQIDGNFGFASGVAEMLLQSQNQEIHLLPALPNAWPAGAVRGLRARGGHTVDIEWTAGRLKSATVHAGVSGEVAVRYGQLRKAIRVKTGRSHSLGGLLAPG